MDYLKKMLQPVLDEYRELDELGNAVENAPIWVCWWMGEETAPPLVQQCIKSIRRNQGDHPLCLITEKNYREYLELPTFILKKLEDGKIGLAHLSDYIRISLLEKYGGLWLDATIFCSKEISDCYFDLPFFTFKSPEKESRYLSKYRWTTFCLGGRKSNVLFQYLKAAFEYYWANAPIAIDYLFFDHLIDLGYRELPAIKHLVDNVPENNLRRDDLQAAMNARVSASEFNEIIDSDTDFYKLSWRETYELTTVDGKESIYQHVLSMDL